MFVLSSAFRLGHISAVHRLANILCFKWQQLLDFQDDCRHTLVLSRGISINVRESGQDDPVRCRLALSPSREATLQNSVICLDQTCDNGEGPFVTSTNQAMQQTYAMPSHVLYQRTFSTHAPALVVHVGIWTIQVLGCLVRQDMGLVCHCVSPGYLQGGLHSPRRLSFPHTPVPQPITESHLQIIP